MAEKKTGRWRDSWLKIAEVFRHSIGTLLVFLGVYYLLMTYVLIPLLSRLWGLALHTTPDGYLTEANFTVIFRCPLVILAAILIAVIYALLVFWQTSGIITALEWAWQGHPISILGLFPASFQNMSEAVKPKNWGMLLYAVLAVPFASPYSLSTAAGNIVVPEYIEDVIFNKIWLLFLVGAGMAFVFIFVVKRMPVSAIFIIEGTTSRESTKKALRIMKGHVIKSTVLQLIVTLIAYGLFLYLPKLFVILIRYGLGKLYGGSTLYTASAKLVVGNLIEPVLQMIGSSMVMILVMIYILWLYHRYTDESSAALENTAFAGKRWHSKRKTPFRSLVPLVYTVTAVVMVISLIITVNAFTENPNEIEDYIPTTMIAAHRGYSSVAPENTMPAFKAAVEAGVCNYIELDVHPSREGIPVVIHDSNTYRTTGYRADISTLTLEEIEKLDAGSSFSSAFAGTKIPTLEEVLQYCKGKIDLIIEIKNHSHLDGFEQTVVDLVHQYGFEDNAVIHSLSYDSLVAIKEADPDLPCGLIMAIATGGYYDLPCADFFCIEHTFINSNMLKQIHDRGKLVFAWTVDDSSNITNMLDLDVDCLISNYPVRAYKGVHEYTEDLETYLLDLIPIEIPTEAGPQITDPRDAA